MATESLGFLACACGARRARTRVWPVGIKRADMPRVFSYLFTTATDMGDVLEDMHDFGTSSPLAGLGYGLPVARSYARYALFHAQCALQWGALAEYTARSPLLITTTDVAEISLLLSLLMMMM